MFNQVEDGSRADPEAEGRGAHQADFEEEMKSGGNIAFCVLIVFVLNCI